MMAIEHRRRHQWIEARSRLRRSPTLGAFQVALGICLGLLLSTSTALALPTFPGVVQQELGLQAAPPCTTCHMNPAGGGPADTEFAVYLKSRGLDISRPDSLRTALQAAEAERSDSNQNGVADVDELRMGNDPSVADSEGIPPAEYGCAASSAPIRHGFGFAAMGCGVLTWLWLRRRQPRARRLRRSR